MSLGLLLSYQGDFETLWGYFGVALGSCVGLLGPKSGNVEKVLVLKCFLGAECRIPGRAVWDHFEATLGRLL